MSILSKVIMQITNRVAIATEKLSDEKILTLVISTSESSSNAIDKEIEMKNFINLQ